ncbi:MAG: single-stranded DNA-binding protein [Rhizonema sp. PD38]|nr:single-stranded DNA-binding protein [Rhizonema sp. PD38]
MTLQPPYKSESPLWFDLELWGNIAQVAADWVLQGSTVAVTGELVLDKWTDKNTGELREKPIVKVSNLELISSSRKSTESSSNAEVENY